MKHQREGLRLSLCLGQIGLLNPRQHVVQQKHLFQLGRAKHPYLCHTNTPFSARKCAKSTPARLFFEKSILHARLCGYGRTAKRAPRRLEKLQITVQKGAQIQLLVKGPILRAFAAQKRFRLLHAVAHSVGVLKQMFCGQRCVTMAAHIAQGRFI